MTTYTEIFRAEQCEDIEEIEPRYENAITWRGDTSLLTSGTSTGQINIWDTDKGMLLDSFIHTNISVEALAWSPELDRLAVSYQTGLVEILSYPGKQEISHFLREDKPVVDLTWVSSELIELEISDDYINKNLISTKGYIWDLARDRLIRNPYRPRFSRENYAECWQQVHERDPEWYRTKGSLDEELSKIDESANFLIQGTRYGRVFVWSVQDQNLWEFRNDLGDITAFAWKPESTVLAVGGYSGRIAIIDAAAKKHISTLECDDEINGIAWNASGNRIAAETWSEMIYVWKEQ